MADTFDWSSFIEVPGFLGRWGAIRATEGDLRQLQLELLTVPTGWPVVPGAGGWRKARFAPPSWGRGKSGGVRVYYADLPDLGIILLGTAFAKSTMSDLTAKDKKSLAVLLMYYRKILGGDL